MTKTKVVTKITATLEIVVSDFGPETTEFVERRMERIKKDLKDRGLVRTTISVVGSTLHDEQQIRKL